MKGLKLPAPFPPRLLVLSPPSMPLSFNPAIVEGCKHRGGSGRNSSAKRIFLCILRSKKHVSLHKTHNVYITEKR